MITTQIREVGNNSAGYQSSAPTSAPQVSEIDRETQGVDTQLTHLENSLQLLRQRLGPVILQSDKLVGGQATTRPAPSSVLGGQLRTYANRAESIAETIDYLLENLALA